MCKSSCRQLFLIQLADDGDDHECEEDGVYQTARVFQDRYLREDIGKSGVPRHTCGEQEGGDNDLGPLMFPLAQQIFTCH